MVNIALTLITPGSGALGSLLTGLHYAQAVGGGVNSFEAFFINGDILGGALSLAGAVLSGIRGVTQKLNACGFITSGAANTTNQILGWVTRGLLVIGAGQSLKSANDKFQSGDILGGVLDMAQAGADLFQATRACFTRETRVLTRLGWIRFDELTELDEVASSDENDPFGPVAFKQVAQVYQFPSVRIWHVHVKGKVIRTTGEHPFYVWGKGWTEARSLEPGDRLRSHDEKMVMVEEVFDSRVKETVYNCAVTEYHTYFVGAKNWGFSVWAHNTYGKGKDPTTPNTAARKRVQGKYKDPLTNKTVKTSETLAADHIFPKSKIKKLPGFSKLTKAQKAKVLNYAKNFQGLPTSVNSSKGGRLATEWNNLGGNPLNSGYQRRLGAQQRQLKKELQQLINGFLGK